MNYINSTLCKVFLLKFQLNHIDVNYDTYNNDPGQHHQPPVGRLSRCVTLLPAQFKQGVLILHKVINFAYFFKSNSSSRVGMSKVG
jgi:hypothetical protein